MYLSSLQVAWLLSQLVGLTQSGIASCRSTRARLWLGSRQKRKGLPGSPSKSTSHRQHHRPARDCSFYGSLTFEWPVARCPFCGFGLLPDSVSISWLCFLEMRGLDGRISVSRSHRSAISAKATFAVSRPRSYSSTSKLNSLR